MSLTNNSAAELAMFPAPWFSWCLLQTAPETFGAIIAIGLLSVVLDTLVPTRTTRPTTAKPTRPRSLGIADRLSAPRPRSPAT